MPRQWRANVLPKRNGSPITAAGPPRTCTVFRDAETALNIRFRQNHVKRPRGKWESFSWVVGGVAPRSHALRGNALLRRSASGPWKQHVFAVLGDAERPDSGFPRRAWEPDCDFVWNWVTKVGWYLTIFLGIATKNTCPQLLGDCNGKLVRIQRGPATVTGYESRLARHCLHGEMGRLRQVGRSGSQDTKHAARACLRGKALVNLDVILAQSLVGRAVFIGIRLVRLF